MNRLLRARASESRSSALAPLNPLSSVLVGALLVLVLVKAPTWLLGVVAGFLLVIVVTFVSSYLFLLRHNVEALRSESFTLEKLRIDRGLLGDTSTGFNDPAAGGELAESSSVGSVGEEGDEQ